MVSSKKMHCAFCQKKCSGNVLRYQDRYYHKQCFELEQTSGAARAAAAASERQLAAAVPSERPTMSSGGDMTPSPSPATRRYLSTSPKSRTIDARQQQQQQSSPLSRGLSASSPASKSATLPHSISSPASGLSSAASGQLPLSQSTSISNGAANTNSTSSHRGQASSNSKLSSSASQQQKQSTSCAGCRELISDGQALIALDLHWHVWCFKCAQCNSPLHGEYVAKEGRAYCERDYQKLFGITCVYCKRYITGKVLQAGEAHHFHPSCARCSKCGDPFVPGEEMYLQGEVTWHPRCGPGPNGVAPAAHDLAGSSLLESESGLRAPRAQTPSLSSGGGGGGGRSRSASPFSYMSGSQRPYGSARARSPAGGYAESEAVGDLSRIYTISYLNADPNQGYLRRPIEPYPPKSTQFSRPTSLSRLGGGGGAGSNIGGGAASDRSRCSSRSQQYIYGGGGGGSSARERSVPRGMYSVLSSMRSTGARSTGGGSSLRARSPSMMNEEAIALASYPSGQKPAPDSVPKIERDDFPAPPFPYPDRHHHHHHHQHHQHQHGHNHSHHSHHGQQPASHNGHETSKSRGKQQVDAAGEQVSAGENGSLDDDDVPRASVQRPVQQERASRPRSREIAHSDRHQRDSDSCTSATDSSGELADPQFRKEEEELSKIANGIGKIFLQTLKEREKLRAWKRANLDPRNASRTPSATRELTSRPLRYDNPTNASPSRDLDRARAWAGLDDIDGQGPADGAAGEQSPTRTRSSLGRSTALSGASQPTTGGGRDTAATTTPSALSSSYGYKVVQSNRSTPRPGYGLSAGPYGATSGNASTLTSATNGPLPHSISHASELSFAQQQRVAQARAADLLGRAPNAATAGVPQMPSRGGSMRSLASSAHFRRSMPNVAQLQSNGNTHQHHNSSEPPKLYPYHLLATSNYRLPPGVDRCHLERHLSNEEFQYIFHCDRLDFYRLPEWKRNELKRRARLF